MTEPFFPATLVPSRWRQPALAFTISLAEPARALEHSSTVAAEHIGERVQLVLATPLPGLLQQTARAGQVALAQRHYYAALHIR